jgi:hypothetical protein
MASEKKITRKQFDAAIEKIKLYGLQFDYKHPESNYIFEEVYNLPKLSTTTKDKHIMYCDFETRTINFIYRYFADNGILNLLRTDGRVANLEKMSMKKIIAHPEVTYLIIKEIQMLCHFTGIKLQP